MNRIETALINSFVRGWLQRTYERRVLLRLGGQLAGGTAVEIGCGKGVGVEIDRQPLQCRPRAEGWIDSLSFTRPTHAADSPARPR